MLWSEPAGAHSSESSGACKDNFPLCPVFGGLNPNGVAVGVIDDHLVPVASAGCEWESSSLVQVDCVASVICLDVDVLLCVGGVRRCRHDWSGAKSCLGGVYPLTLATLVPLLSFFGLWKVLVYI